MATQGLRAQGRRRRRRGDRGCPRWRSRQGEPAGRAAARRRARCPPAPKPFYAGCALPQDKERTAGHRQVAAASSAFRLAEADGAGCCGHPSRGKVGGQVREPTSRCSPPARPATTACARPEMRDDAALAGAGRARAARRSAKLEAPATRFVPYVGCLGERDRALRLARRCGRARRRRDRAVLPLAARGLLRRRSAACTAARPRPCASCSTSPPSEGAPVVTPCLLCRDNLRSAARTRERHVPDLLLARVLPGRRPPRHARSQPDGAARAEAR